MAFNENLFFSGQDFKLKMMQLISSAKKNIFLCSYIFSNDSFGAEVWNHLCVKARSGVNVRLLLDGFGSRLWLSHLPNSIPENLEIRVFHPLPWPLSGFQLHEFPNLLRFFSRLYKINRRSHQKALLIDNHWLMVGSRNINMDSLTWRETSALLSGDEVAHSEFVFHSIWKSAQALFKKEKIRPNLAKRKKTKACTWLFSNHNLSGRLRRHYMLIGRLRSAEKFIYITTPYFLAPPHILKTLKKKARAGIDVRLLLPGQSDVLISKWIAEIQYETLLKDGVKIYEYKSQILHAKTLMTEQTSIIGSSNFNYRSLMRDLELDVILRSTEAQKELLKKFQDDLVHSKKIEQPSDLKVPWYQKLIVNVILLFRGSF